jgi:hypothetical protein
MSKQARQAINFLRGRQEKSDLRYWLSIVNYDPEERTFSNRIYLVYLIIFFTIWVFITLVYAATFLLKYFPITGPIPPETIMASALLLSFLVLALNTLLSASKRSPLIFTDEQRFLLCQQPVPPRPLVFRWVFTPWAQNFLLFILICLMLGFTLGEIAFPPDKISQYFFVYVWYGLRVVLLAAPFHLGAFLLSWAAGIFAMNHRGKLIAWLPSIIFAILLLLSAFSFLSSAYFSGSYPILQPFNILVSNILLSFFGAGNYGFGVTFLIGGVFALLAASLIWLVSKNFSPSKAASETETAALVTAYRKFGQLDALKTLRQKERLGLTGRRQFTPDWQNEKAFAWKALLVTRRNFGLGDLWHYLVSFLFMLSFSYAGNTPLAWLGLASWIWLLSGNSTELFKRDLSLWSLTRQIPVPIKKWSVIDLLLPALPHMAAALLGLLVGQLFFKTGSWQFIPIVLVGLFNAQLQLGHDLLRKNQVELLAAGNVQNFGLRGLVMAILFLILPLMLLLIPLGIFNFAIGTLSALFFAWVSWISFEHQVARYSVEKKPTLFMS